MCWVTTCVSTQRSDTTKDLHFMISYGLVMHQKCQVPVMSIVPTHCVFLPKFGLEERVKGQICH